MTVAKRFAHKTQSQPNESQPVLVVGTTPLPCQESDYVFRMVGERELWQKVETALAEYSCVILALPQHSENLRLCQQLRLHPASSEFPILVCVADTTAAAEAIQAGGSDFCFTANAAAELPARIRLCLLNHLHAQRIAWQLDEQQRELTISHLLMDRRIRRAP